MSPCLRPASRDDAASVAALFEAVRAEYEGYSPVFWRRAPNARSLHEPFLRMLIEQDGPITLVSAGNAEAPGGVEAAIVALPRADDWLVDDFAVRRPEQWAELGPGLLAAVREAVPDSPVTVVCGRRDEPKRAMLRQAGGRLTEEWWVRPLADVARAAASEPAGATGQLVTAPPVYDPGGPVCSVTSWDGTAGALDAVEAWAAAQGAVLAVVAVAADAVDRQEALDAARYTATSEWYRFRAARRNEPR
jgi:hypothetical protein